MTPWDDALAVAARFEAFAKSDAPFSQTDLAMLIRDYGIRCSNAELERKRDAIRQLESFTRDCDPALGRAKLDVAVELHKARTKHAPMHSPHEGYAVISEELDELWEEIKKRKPDPVRLRAEAVQVAAMAMRFLVDVCQPPDTPVEHVAEEVCWHIGCTYQKGHSGGCSYGGPRP